MTIYLLKLLCHKFWIIKLIYQYMTLYRVYTFNNLIKLIIK